MSVQQTVYRRLGRSGLRVSVPIIGAMSFGTLEWAPWVLPKEKALPILKAAWDRGVNTIDTANVYSNGESERIIGTFMKEFNIPREKLVILIKVCGIVAQDPSVHTYFHPNLRDERDYVNQTGLSRAAIFNAVDASLERLQTSYIDLLQIHRFDPATEVEETMKALHDLVQAGKVRYIGASSMRAWHFARMNYVAEKNGWTRFISMQSEYSLLYREEEREMNAYCNFESIGLIPWWPLASGKLARPLNVQTQRSRGIEARGLHEGEAEDEIVRRVEEISKKKGLTMAQVALGWSASKVTSPIVGINSVERLEEAIPGNNTLTEEETKYLEEPYVPKPVRGQVGSLDRTAICAI